MRVCLGYVAALEITQKKSADESRAPVLRRQGAQGDPQLTELSALQCFPLRCAGTQVSCTVRAQPSTSPQRDALMLEARWRLHFQKATGRCTCVVLGCTYIRLFRPPSGLGGAGLGILAGTSPLQHFFFWRGRREEVFDGSLHLPVKRCILRTGTNSPGSEP